MRGLAGEVAVVTGAASGIGRAVACELAGHGARVAVIDIRPADETLALLDSLGAGSFAATADVRDRESLAKAARAIDEALGEPSLLVNNAGGVPRKSSLLDLPVETWEDTLALNLTSVLHGLAVFAPAMVRRRRGAVVNVASTAGRFAWPGQGAYAAAKAGVVGLTRAAAFELGGSGVRVNCVLPATVDTPGVAGSLADPAFRENEERATALGRLARPEDVARLVAFLLSDEAAYLTGADVLCDGGYSLSGQTHIRGMEYLF
jgi:NAD(P)-dependent dehydrogenase (short-subunit alcohol dehydrogenase family)